MFDVMMITSRRLAGQSLSQLVSRAVAGGVDAVQVREKDLSARKLYHLTHAVIEAVAGRALVIVNTHLDVALAAGADGCHLTSKSVPVAGARLAAPKGFLLGYSAHSVEDCLLAESEGASYVTLSPIFKTASKRKAQPLGLPYLERALLSVRIPVVALGGVSLNNAEALGRAGVPAIATIRAVSAARNPTLAARRLKLRFTKARGPRV
jgi:thiamine-phosphate pyrophosphorylase